MRARPAGGAALPLALARLLLATLLLAALLAIGAGTASARLAGAATPLAGTPAPKVTKQPTNLTVEEGQSASFESTASNSPTVQWESSSNAGSTWTPIEGATSTLYAIPSASTSESGHQFRAVFKNAGGEVTSKAVTLTVQRAPAVTQQPLNATTEEAHAVKFEAAASGFPTPTVQWQSEANGSSTWKNVAGATSSVLTVANPKLSENQTQFRAIFKNAAGEATSSPATMTVANAPKVTKQPSNLTVKEGEIAIFESTATGSPSAAEQWELSTDHGATWSPIPGAEFSQLAVKGTNGSFTGNQYRARFTNVAGSVTSSAATLTVQAKPTLTQQPQDELVLLGESASFQAAAKGLPTPTVQWEVSSNAGVSWSPIPGATSDVLTLAETQLSQNGNLYRALYTNSVGTTASEPAKLVVSATNYDAFGWGMNNHGEVGSGSTEPTITSPMPVKGLEFVTALSAGTRHSLALIANGRVESWGFNGHGQLGQEGAVGSRVPIAVEIVKTATAIAAGGNHSLALLGNGTVMAWGDDESGQLGNGKHVDSEYPIAVPELSNVTAIAAGEEHSLALLGDGTVVAWGNNERGQLGTGNTTSQDTPAPVKGLSNVAAIAAGGQYSLALLKDGTVLAWGDDEHGQLGNAVLLKEEQEEETKAREEEGFDSTAPVPVESLAAVQRLAAGRTHALALLENGTVMSWGQGSEGELGNGAMEARVDMPVPVTGLANVTEVTAGDQTSAALLNNGLIDAWGNNSTGALGQGATSEDSDVPLTVSSLGGAAGISAGGRHMLAFGASLPAVTAISPKGGATAGGTTVTISGADLGSAIGVKFGTSAAASFTVNSSSSITATSPPGSGTVHVTVVTPTGSSPPVAADRFSYRVPPTIVKMSAKGGPATGGTSVTISGTEFVGVSVVSFGGVPAASYTVNSPISITATAPANTGGTVDVRVTAVGGQSPVTTKDRFKYAPVIEGLSPASSPVAGGVSVLVSGAGFAPGSATSFKFGKAGAQTVECASSTSCTVTAPAQKAAGVVTVVASVGKVKSAAGPGSQFTYE